MTTSPLAIRARNLGKSYRLYPSPLDAFLEAATRKRRHSEFKALDDINLDLHRGEIVGIMGRNGAGKSTLLKLIAGTLAHTSGELEVNGRITAILELGTGFNPEHTGRSNIYMGGMCLGMSKREINEKIDSIIEFSELKDVIDQPFKTYSTGMQARLTFSTAISVDPEILIVDEALSVGDARFQMKCFNWLQNLREKQTTILLVSHDSNTITRVCDRALVLEKGKTHYYGDAKEGSEVYLRLLYADDQNIKQAELLPIEGEEDCNNRKLSSSFQYGDGEAQLTGYGLMDEANRPISLLPAGSRCRIYLNATCFNDIDDLVAAFAIKDRRGTFLWGMNNLTKFRRPVTVNSNDSLTASVHCTMNLAAGNYFINLGISHSTGKRIDFIENAIEFKVTGTEELYTISCVSMNEIYSIEVD
ncbi:MAG: ABC transporter ATP-binding protein [Desulfarculaceae bacterium]|nr:ABC transporter ATP-binding protein [Desulfarculaceae bacterium]MCF8122402.1 ABC transporter ATP-binding protein [Desulfarculaceae bacterium]